MPSILERICFISKTLMTTRFKAMKHFTAAQIAVVADLVEFTHAHDRAFAGAQPAGIGAYAPVARRRCQAHRDPGDPRSLVQAMASGQPGWQHARCCG